MPASIRTYCDFTDCGVHIHDHSVGIFELLSDHVIEALAAGQVGIPPDVEPRDRSCSVSALVISGACCE
jgi:hypothetical protein